MAIDFPTDTRSIERITSQTVDELAPVVRDNAYGDFATLNAVRNSSGVEQSWEGSDQLGHTVTLEKQPAGGSISPFGVVDMTPGDTETRANFLPKQYATSIVVSIGDLQRLSGRLAVANYLQTRTKHAMKKAMDLLNGAQGLHGDGTLAATNIIGLHAIMDITPAVGTYGGINKATNARWRNIAVDNGNVTADVLEDLRTLHTQLTSGSDGPDLVITNRTGRDVYESKLTATLRVDPMLIARDGANAQGDAGILSLTYKGIPVVTDEDFVLLDGSSNWFFLNTRYLHWRVHPEANFTNTGMQESEDQLILKGKIHWHGAFTSDYLLRQGLVHNGPAN